LTEVSLPNATTFGSYCLSSNQALTEVSLPNATTFGSYCLRYNQALTEVSLLNATTFGSDCLSSNQALTEVSLPNATTFGSDCLSSNQALTEVSLPNATTFGSYCLSYNQALTEVSLPKLGIEQEVKNVDGFCFIVENRKTSKGIIIYTGYNFNSSSDELVDKTDCFVSEKDGFTAHGDTVKKSIQDLQFKIASERLKNEPIYPDTKITVQLYRIITGACDSGVRGFMSLNSIPFKVVKNTLGENETIEQEPMLAKDLLLILEKTDAYGFEKFKKLYNT
jgi:hypothetical protein